MIGPESENIPAFFNFAPVVKDKGYCPIYAYHPYNFNAGTDISQTTAQLGEMHRRFGDKPGIMTEYAAMPWFKTARFIHQAMKYAHASGYIYWELVWGDANTKDKAMIYIDGAGNYTVSPFYYVIKHFAKYVDAGHIRVEVTSSTPALEVTGYMHPDRQQLTLVIVNPEARAFDYAVEVTGEEVKGMEGYQSVEGNFFKPLGSTPADGTVKIPASSITTMVLAL